jgi:F-box domain
LPRRIAFERDEEEAMNPVMVMKENAASGGVEWLDQTPRIRVLFSASFFYTSTTIMPSIPVDVLREILEHVSDVDLATLCQVNKIVCSCSQDVLYRNISVDDPGITQILARSTDLAKRVRSFQSYSTHHPPQELSMALKNMSSLRHLGLIHVHDATVLDGCTFQLDSFDCSFYDDETLRKFLASQPSITHVDFRCSGLDDSIPFEQTLLPNLTWVDAGPEWLPRLIPGRPVRSIITFEFDPRIYKPDVDLIFFALSTGPLQKLSIPIFSLYPKPESLFISTFPFLTHLRLYAYVLSDYFMESPYVHKTSLLFISEY